MFCFFLPLCGTASFVCSLHDVCIVIVSGGPLRVNVSVLLLSLASPDESSLVSTDFSVLLFSIKCNHLCDLSVL
jgi:hypothetical protein